MAKARREKSPAPAAPKPAPQPPPPSAAKPAKPPVAFACAAGIFLFIVITKFGDPVIISTDFMAPHSVLEGLDGPWPAAWAYWILGLMAVAGAFTIRWRQIRWKPVMFLPLGWLAWQVMSAGGTVDAQLTSVTLPHFAACVFLFFFGFWGLNGWRNPWPLWAGLALALCWTMHSGIDQHFGGLEATRRYFHSVYGEDWQKLAKEMPTFVKKVESNRIFGTFVYPNAFAGAILLLLPLTLAFVWDVTPKVSTAGRCAFVGILGGCGLATLAWSGSKAGWLIAVVMAVIALCHSRLALKWRLGAIGALVVVGLTLFALRNMGYFERGATSAVARFDYWKAAATTFAHNPVFGTGPGTFSRPYAKLKDPTSEMARLCHNDYLEQATDSGLIGAAAFAAFIGYSAVSFYRYWRTRPPGPTALESAVFIGLLGLCLHEFVEYHLYIPGLSWPMFFLLGWAWSLI